MIDIEALAAPAFLIEVSADGASMGARLNGAARARPELTRCLSDSAAIADLAGLSGGPERRVGKTADAALMIPGCSTDAGWQVLLVPVLDGTGRTEAVLGICHTVRAPDRAADRLSLTLQAIHGAEWRYDVVRGVYESSDEIATLMGEGAPRPVTWAEWLERVHPADLPSFLSCPDPDGTAEFRFQAADGELRWARCSRIAVTGEAGTTEAVLGVMVDITPERVRETAWAELATHDPLTGLLNRRGLRQELDRLQAEPPSTSCLALFAVDLDWFKETNDVHGHAAGDAVLAEVARRLTATVPGAACARLGGDEFVVVLPVLAEAEAQDARMRLGQALRHPLTFRGRWLPTSASVGLAIGNGTSDLARLLDDADADLYTRKRARTYIEAVAA